MVLRAGVPYGALAYNVGKFAWRNRGRIKRFVAKAAKRVGRRRVATKMTKGSMLPKFGVGRYGVSNGRKNNPYGSVKYSKSKGPRTLTMGSIGPRMRIKKNVDPFAKFNKYGVTKNTEVYGNNAAANALYLEATIAIPYEWLTQIVQCMVRRLLEKAGIRVVSTSDIISATNLAENSIDLEVCLYVQNQAGTTSRYPFTLGSKSVKNITFFLLPFFIDYSSGATNNAGAGDVKNLDEPKMLTFGRVGNVLVTGAPMIYSSILLDEVYLEGHLRMISKVQNRTKGVSGGTTEDDIANQPIVGTLYYFNGLPRSKIGTGSNTNQEETVFAKFPVDRHLKTINDTEVSTELGEPPSRKSWWNCIGSSNVRLNPGEIRTFTCYQTIKKQRLLGYLKKFRLQYGTNAPADPESKYSTNYCPLKTVLFAFEEMIQSSSEANTLTIGYEIESKAGCYISERKSKWCRTEVLTVQAP